MVDRKERAAEHDKDIELWRDLRQENYRHWRAWGSWFSWGSPVGLGLFFVLASIAAAILIWIIKL